VTLATRPFCAETANTRLRSILSVSLTLTICRRTSASISVCAFSASHRPSILFSTTM
jgi:hypothetical protein